MEFKNIIWYLTQFGLKGVLPILALPILTRHLTPEDFGLYALSIFYGTVVTGIINFGLTSLYERSFFELNHSKRKNLLFTNIVFIISLFLIFCFLTNYFDEFIAIKIFKKQQLRNYLMLAFTFQTFKSLNVYFLSYFKNYEKAKSFSIISSFESFFSTGLAVLLVIYFSMGLKGFLIGQMIGVIITFIFTFLYIFYPFSNQLEIQLLKEQLKLSIYLTPNIFFGIINSQFDKYMLGLINSIGGVGIYDIGQKIAYFSFTFMTAVQNVFSPQVYKRLFSENKEFRQSVGRYLTPYFYLCILICLIIGTFSDEIIFTLATEKYDTSATIISILSILYGIYFFGKQPQLLHAKKTGLMSILQIASIIINIGLNIPFIKYFGVLGAACATLISGLISTALYLYFSQRYSKINYERKIFVLLTYFISSILIKILIYNNLDLQYFYLLVYKLIVIIVYLIFGIHYGILKNFNHKNIKLFKLRDNSKGV